MRSMAAASGWPLRASARSASRLAKSRAHLRPVSPGPSPADMRPGAHGYFRNPRNRSLLDRERATGRGMATATYASMLLRVHLRAAAPLPDRELDALKGAVA